MNFYEAFFSTEKLLIPAISQILLGLLFIIISVFFDIKIGETELIIFLLIGFIIGNWIKANKLIEEEENRSKKSDKK